MLYVWLWRPVPEAGRSLLRRLLSESLAAAFQDSGGLGMSGGCNARNALKGTQKPSTKAERALNCALNRSKKRSSFLQDETPQKRFSGALPSLEDTFVIFQFYLFLLLSSLPLSRGSSIFAPLPSFGLLPLVRFWKLYIFEAMRRLCDSVLEVEDPRWVSPWRKDEAEKEGKTKP